MIYNLFTRQKINRVSFDMSSLAPVIFSYAVRTGSTVAFIGSKQDNLEKFTAIVKNTFPGLNIVYLRHGYFENAESYEKAVVEVAQVNPDIVIAGLGTPLQEKFLVNLAQQGWNKLGFTCGGFMSQTQEKLNYYPAWIDKLNLRWVYRIVNESHTRKRFFKTYLIFPLIFTRDMIKGKFLRNAA